MNLYEMSGALRDLCELMASGDLTPEQADEAAAMASRLLAEDLPQKVDNYCGLLKSMEGDEATLKAEEERLAKRRKASENARKRLMGYLDDGLHRAGLEKVKGTRFTVSLAKKPPSLRVVDEAQIPAHYWTEQPPKLDKRGLLLVLKTGEEVPGAEIVTGAKRLSIR